MVPHGSLTLPLCRFPGSSQCVSKCPMIVLALAPPLHVGALPRAVRPICLARALPSLVIPGFQEKLFRAQTGGAGGGLGGG